MSIPVHTVQVLDPQTGNDFFDRVILAQKVNLAYRRLPQFCFEPAIC